GIVVNVTRADRRRLEVILSDRSAPQKHVWRAQIILATADGCGTIEIMLRVDPLALDYQRRARVTRPGRQGRQAGSRRARYAARKVRPSPARYTNTGLNVDPANVIRRSGRARASLRRVAGLRVCDEPATVQISGMWSLPPLSH